MATITIVLVYAATSILLCATVASSTDPQQERQTNATSHQEQWTPVLPQSKQDGGVQYLDPSQQVLLISPEHVASPAVREPARGEVINTDPLQPPVLQQAGSGVVLQIHPQYLKGYPTNQNPHTLKHNQGAAGTNLGQAYNRNQNLPGTQVSLQVQPQFVLTGVHNPALSQKQVQAPLYYNNQALTYQNQLKPIQLTPPSPTVLAQLAAAQYPQLFQTNQPVKVLGQPTGITGLHLNGLVQHPLKPTEQANFGLTKQNPAGKVRNQVRDTSTDEGFPDFGKMFESYFKSGPFGQAFKNDNPENTDNLKINTNDDFPTGDFFGFDKPKAASSNQQLKQNDGEFQPCDFFKAANQKVVESDDDENDDDDDSEQDGTEKRAARDPNNFGKTRGHQHRPRDNEESPNSPRTKNHGDGFPRYRDDDDYDKRHQAEDEDESESPHHRPSQSQYRPNSQRHKESDDDDDNDKDNKRPANFHHYHNHDGYSKKPSHNRNNGGNYGRPHQEQNGGVSYGQPKQHNYGSPSQEHKSLGSYGQQSQEQRSGVNYDRPSQKNNHGGNYGRPSQGHNEGNYERPSQGQRPSSERHEESRPSYGHNNDDEDEHRARPSNSYKQGQESPAKPAAIKTFHQYNFPPAPDYSREASNRDRQPQGYAREASYQRPPSPVREAQGTLEYYTYLAPAVGNSDIYYLSEKQLIAKNQSST